MAHSTQQVRVYGWQESPAPRVFTLQKEGETRWIGLTQPQSTLRILEEKTISGHRYLTLEVTGLTGYGHDGSSLQFQFIYWADENEYTGYILLTEPAWGNDILAAY